MKAELTQPGRAARSSALQGNTHRGDCDLFDAVFLQRNTEGEVKAEGWSTGNKLHYINFIPTVARGQGRRLFLKAECGAALTLLLTTTNIQSCFKLLHTNLKE